MNYFSRRIKESPIYQGVDERLIYTLTTTPWGGGSTTPAYVIKDSTGTVVTATYVTGSPSGSGDIITAGVTHSLTAGAQYRMEWKWVNGSNTYEAWADLYGQT